MFLKCNTSNHFSSTISPSRLLIRTLLQTSRLTLLQAPSHSPKAHQPYPKPSSQSIQPPEMPSWACCRCYLSAPRTSVHCPCCGHSFCPDCSYDPRGSSVDAASGKWSTDDLCGLCIDHPSASPFHGPKPQHSFLDLSSSSTAPLSFFLSLTVSEIH